MSKPEKDTKPIKEERLEKIIEQKVEKKTQKLEKQNQQLKKEIQALKSDSNKISRTKTKASQNEGISRRSFLRKAGLGSVGLAALMSPVSALNISTGELSVKTGSDSGSLTENLTVDADGNIEIPNGNLDVSGNSIENVSGFSGSNGIIGVDELDTGISPTWTGEQTFDEHSNYTLEDGRYVEIGDSFDNSRFSLVAREEDGSFLDEIWNYNVETEEFDIRPSVLLLGDTTIESNLRLDTGQAIEDGDGADRVEIDNNLTYVYDETGNEAFRADSADGGGVIMKRNSGRFLRDLEGDFPAIEYQTSEDAPGALELTNADLDIENNNIVQSPDNNSIFKEVFAEENMGESETFNYEEIFYTTRDNSPREGIRTIYYDRPGDTTYSSNVREVSLEKRIIVGQTGTTSVTQQTGWFLDSGPHDEYSARFGIATDDPSHPFVVYDEQSDGNAFEVQDGGEVHIRNGDLDIGGNDVVNESDRRLKSEVESIENAVSRVLELEPSTFVRDGGDERQAGLFAQNVDEVLPEAVKEGSDGYLRLSMNQVVPLLVAAIQEQQKDIEKLR